MEERELREIYADACAAKGYDIDPDQYKLWKQQLVFCDKRDVRAGLERWWQTETRLPMPSELKPLVEQSRRTRAVRATESQSLVRYHCPGCDYGACGFVPEHDMAGRRCLNCGTMMNELQRVRSAA